MTLEQALCHYLDLVNNVRIYDDFMTTLALELMFYNENYQVGVIISKLFANLDFKCIESITDYLEYILINTKSVSHQIYKLG